ncbi:MAG: CheB methylesterase domain-containing protein [Rickettsiales bacterium]|nr:CheB methylesterase domain-containing protein [Rickettsiales bacterium]
MQKKYKLIPKTSLRKPRAILIGSSTGGLQAVSRIFSELKNYRIEIPILITQHIPENIDKSFVDKIASVSGLPTKLAEENEEIIAGKIYVAPSNKHLSLEKKGDRIVACLLDTPPINFCKPAVDPMFSSAAEVWNGNVFGVILTGIGNDGLEGARKIVEEGGIIIAQDEETSVVWGMPGAVAKEGLCTEILPIDKIAEYLRKNSMGVIF